MDDTIHKLVEAGSQYQESCILGAMAELDLCTIILENSNSISAQELAQKTSSDKRGLTFLLDALVGSGYLQKSGKDEAALYAVKHCFQAYLDSRQPATVIPLFRHMACVQRNWTQLAKVVKEGEPAKHLPSILGAEQDRLSFIMAMNSIAVATTDKMVKELVNAHVFPEKTQKYRFIDIGGASGTYTWAFLETLPRSTAMLFDLPVGVEAAKKRFIGSRHEDRVQFMEGDFTKDQLPSGFDFAWLSAIIHQQGREENRKLYANTFQALKPGGRVAVRDFIMNEDRTHPKEGTFFGINMLVQTATGMVYTFDEVKEDLEAEGFTDIKLAIPADTMLAVVTGEKPA